MTVAGLPDPEEEQLFTDSGQVAPGVPAVSPPVSAGGAAPDLGPPPGGVAQPADIPGGQLNTDQLMAAAAGSPNPQGDAVDQVLAAHPDAAGSQAPALQAPPQAVPGAAGSPLAAPGGVQQQELANLSEQDKLAEQDVDAKKREGTATAAVAGAEAQGADKAAEIEAQAAARQEKVINTANAATQQWAENAQQQAQAYQKLQLHDYWADKSTGSKVLAGIAMLFGAAGRTSAADNPALQIINQAIDRDFRMQQAGIEKAKGNIDVARDQYAMGLTSKQQALADNNLKKAASLDAAAAQTVALKLKQGVPLAQAQNDAAVIALRQRAAATREETFKVVHAQNVQDAHLAIEKQNADSARLRAEKYKMRGAGAGGAGGGDAMSQFIAAANELKPGDPVTPQIAKLALAARIKPNQIADQVNKYRNSGANSTKAASAAGLGDERQAAKEADQWRKENGVDAIAKKQQELSSVLDEVKNAPHNPLQQALAVEKAVSSARGGAASRQALDLALHHLGPKYTSMEDVKNAIVNKEIGSKQMDNFIGFMANQLGTAQKEGRDKYDAFDKYIESQPPEKRAVLEAQRGRLFSGLHGFGGSGQASKPVQAGGNARIEAAKRVAADPTVDPVVRGRATAFLRANGAL